MVDGPNFWVCSSGGRVMAGSGEVQHRFPGAVNPEILSAPWREVTSVRREPPAPDVLLFCVV